MSSWGGTLDKAFTISARGLLETKSTSVTSKTKGCVCRRSPLLAFLRLLQLFLLLFLPLPFLISCLPSPPSSLGLVHCFISAPGPPACPRPGAPGRFAFPAAAPASPTPRVAAAIWPRGFRPSGITRQDAGGEALASGVAKPGRRREARLSGGRRCQLASSHSAPGWARIAGLRAEPQGVGCHFVIFLPKEWSVGKEWGRNTNDLGSSETRVLAAG